MVDGSNAQTSYGQSAVTSKNGLTQHNLTFQEGQKTDLHTYIANILKMLTNKKFGCQLFRPY